MAEEAEGRLMSALDEHLRSAMEALRTLLVEAEAMSEQIHGEWCSGHLSSSVCEPPVLAEVRAVIAQLEESLK